MSPIDARIDLSDSSAAAGSVVVATLRLVGSLVATATVRLSYDTAGLAFAGADSLDDGAMRAINPVPGLVRVAAMAASGIANGRVNALRFTVLRPAALRTMKVRVDEAHTMSGVDVASRVRVP